MYYSYDVFLKDLKNLKNKIELGMGGVPDAILCIARGGMVMSHMLSLAWNIRSVYALNAISYSDTKVQSSLIIENMPNIKDEHKNIVIIDEIIDSGNSLEVIINKLRCAYKDKNFYTGVIFQKLSAKCIADFYIKQPPEWIDFFWEVDMLEDRCSE